MSSKNKRLVDMIKKMAQGAGPPPYATPAPTPPAQTGGQQSPIDLKNLPPGLMGGTNLFNLMDKLKTQPATPSTPGGAGAPPWQQPGGNVPRQTGHYAPGNSSIREMQKAIQEFAAEAVKYRTTPKREGNKVINVINPDDKRRDFNDFLTEQFSASADIHGEEYSPNAANTTRESKSPTDLVQLNNVIDGLQRIGPGSREGMADGVWDFRTNNAVRNVAALAAAMVAANEALGGTAPNDKRVFRRADLQKLQQAIPKEADPMKAKVPQAQLAEKAKEITPLIEKLTEFYKYYSKTIVEHPAYTRYIKGDVPLFNVKPGGGDPAKLDDNQKQLLNQKGQELTLTNLTLPNREGKNVNLNGQVALNYLQTRKGLLQLMVDKLGYKESEVATNEPLLVKTVQNMLTQVNDFLSKNRPIPVAAKPQLEPLPAQVQRPKQNPIV